MENTLIPQETFVSWGKLVADSLFEQWPPTLFFDDEYCSYPDVSNLKNAFINVTIKREYDGVGLEGRVMFARRPAELRNSSRQSLSSEARRELDQSGLAGPIANFFADLTRQKSHAFISAEEEVHEWVVYEVTFVLPTLDFQNAQPMITLRFGQIGKLPIFDDDRWDGPQPLESEKIHRKLSARYTAMKNELES